MSESARKLVVGAVAIVFVCSAALGALCPTCRDKAYTKDIGQCSACKDGMTTSGQFKLCMACSKKLGQCEHCRAPLATGADIVLTDDANGTTTAASVKQTLLVKLPGNPTTGYSWSLSKLEGEAIEAVGKPAYVADKAPQEMVGSGGAFHFTFRAVKPGKATFTLAYARPWEKDTPPIKTFALTVEVKEPAAKAKP